MKNTIRIDHKARLLVMDRTFYKHSTNVRFEEYQILQSVRQDYPTYTAVVRHIKRNPDKETYKGLTYAYMEHYILTHEGADTVDSVMAEYRELRLIAQCHGKSRRYPTIKKWFLAKYPAIEQFGKEPTEQPVTDSDKGFEVVMPPLANAA